jgi:hypothetical protein
MLKGNESAAMEVINKFEDCGKKEKPIASALHLFLTDEEGITDEQDRVFVMTKLKSFPNDQNAMRELDTKFPELLKSEKVWIFIEQGSARSG